MRSGTGHWIVAAVVWIQAAAVTSASAPPADPSDPIAGRGHWAFRPLAPDRQPFAVGDDWSRSTIDDFLFVRLRAAGLAPAPDADARPLLRRLHFHLVGLPPSPEEVARFLDDRRPDAIERVVDALLASPRFGERWGRHWLDLARYADSNGLDENFLFREAWRYRNWVINSLNADMPFDRFILEQVAGDLLPHTSVTQRDSQRIAAGFLAIGPKVLLGNDPRRQRMEIADEQIDTVGRALLGLTLGCARCHDHKFEPVPTADYYALAGIFTSTEVMEKRFMLGEQRVMERLAGLGPEGEAMDAAYEAYWVDLPKVKARSEQAKSALGLIEKGDTDALRKMMEAHPEALAQPARDPALPPEKRLASQQSLVAELTAVIATPPKIPPRAMVPADRGDPADERIRVAGQFDRPGAMVPRGFLQVLTRGGPPTLPAGQAGRIELARWLTDARTGAGHLTARVIVNRLWHHLMGRGLVATVDNFGRTGEPPSHPELLDHLAHELIDSGWSLKSVVRKIALSRAFAMSSAADPQALAVDPDNRLLSRAHRRRLDPESLRDAMLAAAGTLDLTPMESTVSYLGDQATAVGKNEVRRRTDFLCRSVYLPVVRNDLPEIFEAFDFADPHSTTGARPHTTDASQALFMLNDRMVMEAAEALARRTSGEPDPAKRLDRVFELTLGGPPTPDERARFLDFISRASSEPNDRDEAGRRLRAWSTACQAVFSLSRFQFLD